MAITDDGGMVMPVSPYGGYGGNNFGDGSWWILLLFILLGGWGNGFGGGYGGNGAMFVDNGVQRGFDQASIMNGITGVGNNVVSGFGDTATNLCGGFAGVTAAINNGFSQAEIAANARAMSDMQQMFALQSQFSQCCCENRLATANLGSDIAREACATRTSDAQNTQTLLSAINGGIQSIKDQICQDKIDAKNEKIADLERQLIAAQNNERLTKGFADEVDALYNRLSSCPVPSMPVYGRTPIFTCPSQNSGCGCGM